MCVTELPFGLPGMLYSSPMPFGIYDPRKKVFEEYINHQITCIVILVSDEECISNTGYDLHKHYLQASMEVISLPIEDFGVPDRNELKEAINTVIDHLHNGQNLAIHCSAGIGRTGMFAACLARHVFGFSGERSIEWIRRFIPGAVESHKQEEFVLAYTMKEDR
jgi:protein-tyrosine phosphatase